MTRANRFPDLYPELGRIDIEGVTVEVRIAGPSARLIVGLIPHRPSTKTAWLARGGHVEASQVAVSHFEMPRAVELRGMLPGSVRLYAEEVLAQIHDRPAQLVIGFWGDDDMGMVAWPA